MNIVKKICKILAVGILATTTIANVLIGRFCKDYSRGSYCMATATFNLLLIKGLTER